MLIELLAFTAGVLAQHCQEGESAEGPINSREFATRFVCEGSLRQDVATGEQKESHLWGDMNILGLLSTYWR